MKKLFSAKKPQSDAARAAPTRAAPKWIPNRSRNWVRDESGTFAPTFALTLLTVMLSAGAAIDYSQLSRAKSIMNNSLDAAILAAGNDYLLNASSDEALRKVFEDHFYANLSNDEDLLDSATVHTFDFDRETGKVNAEVGSPVQMAFMGVIGKPEIPVLARSEAMFSTTPVEVSMVLDMTGSMNWDGKLDSLKLAAKDAVDILLPAGQPNNQVRLGLVPYSEGVRVNNNQARKASGQSNHTCMTERRYNPYNDRPYTVEPVTADPRANCSTSRVRPLTDNASQLKNDITNMIADGYTAGHLGIAWGYYMLSENWQNLWPEPSKPDNYGGNTKKIAILMTDGSFNTHFLGYRDPRDNPPTIQASNTSATSLCNDMRNSGIEVYSIAFNAPSDAKVTLQACANPDTHNTTYYYDASSEAELRTAFREIASSIKKLRLSR